MNLWESAVGSSNTIYKSYTGTAAVDPQTSRIMPATKLRTTSSPISFS